MPVTDRAKSLIKLVITGFECESGADLFHAQQDVMRWLGASLGRRLSSAEKQQAVADSEDLALAEQSVASIKESKLQYHENLQGLSEDLHPFSLLNNQPQTEERLIDKLEKRVCYFEEIAQKQAIPDKNKAAKKLYNQIKPLATQNMLFREKYQRPRESSSEILRAHPLTHALSDSKLQHWLAWSEWMVQHFHRSSSAVEERNGCLSEMYHQGRGISESRLNALTVIHNYGLKRRDGTTAAQRFFDQDFPDLFSWVLDQMGNCRCPEKVDLRLLLIP